MRHIYLLTALFTSALLCGCNKQAKINSQKIDLLSQKILQMDQTQTKQITLLEAQLTLLAPQLEKMDSSYFEKNRDDALFFHTNTLFLLLSIDKQIEAQLQTADTGRQAQDAEAYNYHTNLMGMIYLCTAQIEAALNAEESRLQDNINTATKQATEEVKQAVIKQITESTAPDPAETAWRKQMETQVAQMQADLDAIKAQLTPPKPAGK